MTQESKYTIGTPEMVKKEAERKKRSHARHEKARQIISLYSIDLIIQAVALVGIVTLAHAYFETSAEEEQSKRIDSRLDIEEKCITRGGTLITSNVRDQTFYCIADNTLLFKVDDLSN